MKRLLSIIPLFILLTTACKKEDKCYDLYGTWKVYDVPTDIIGNPKIIDFDYVTFFSSNHYSVYHADTNIQNGLYSFSRITPPEIFGNGTIKYVLNLKESFNIHPDKNLYNKTGLLVILNGKDSLSLAISVAFSGPNNYWYRFVRK